MSRRLDSENFQKRKLAILCDDSGTKRAVLVAPGKDIEQKIVNELISNGGNLIFVAIDSNQVQAFGLSKMSASRALHVAALDENNQVCVSVEARHGTTTGISVADRTTTIHALSSDQPSPRQIITPGHIFPVEVKDGGVLVRSSLVEGAFDLVKACGFSSSAVFAELLNSSGELMNEVEQRDLASRLGLPYFLLSDVVRYRLETEQLVSRIAETKIPTSFGGEFKAFIYHSSIHSGEHLVLQKGEIDREKPTLTRVQPEFTFADVFGGNNPPSRKTLHSALRAIANEGAGVCVYLRRPSEGQLRDQVKSPNEKFREKPAVMMREYGLGAQILRDMGVRKINLLTNSKRNLVGIKSFGIEIVSITPL